MTHPPASRARPPYASSARLMLAAACIACWSPTYAQQAYAQGPLLDIVRGMREGSWARVNVNEFSEVWAPARLRPLKQGSNPTPHKIISAWSSFAWDSNRGDLIIYGGGHANYSGNDVYRWRSRTLRWERVALPSEISYIGSSAYIAIDGADAAPSSAHTYDNAVFLPLFDRYLNFGGAIYNTGGGYSRRSESDPNVLRRTGPYLANPALAHPDKVGGTTGSHVKRVAPHPEIVGSRMWQNRDLPRHLAGQRLPGSHVNGCTAYSYEADNKDVVYFGARTGGGTAMDLYRYEVTDLARPWLDRITKVGAYWSSPSAQTTCALDPAARIVIKTGSNTSPFFFWDLATAGSSNRERRVSVSGSVAEFTSWLTSIGRNIRHCALDHDPKRGHFLVWCGDGNVWSLKPPRPLALTNWTMTRLTPRTATVPENTVGTGLLGKWKYVPGFDVFVGLQNSTRGNIWVYKPVGWVPPSGTGTRLAADDALPEGDFSLPEAPPPEPQAGGPEPGQAAPAANQPPSVTIAAPGADVVITRGTALSIAGSASDPDGSVTQLALRVDGATIGVANVGSYSATWTPTVSGVYTLTAVATDDRGASATSATVTVTVTDPPTVAEQAPVPVQAPNTPVAPAPAPVADNTALAWSFFGLLQPQGAAGPNTAGWGFMNLFQPTGAPAPTAPVAAPPPQPAPELAVAPVPAPAPAPAPAPVPAPVAAPVAAPAPVIQPATPWNGSWSTFTGWPMF